MPDDIYLAHSAYDRNNFSQAAHFVKRHLRKNRDDGRAWELAGLIHFACGQFRVSVSALERASLFVPLQPAARVCLPHGYLQLGRIDLGRDLLAALCDDQSLSVSLLLQVAAGLNAVDRPHLAMRACRTASACDPHSPQAYYDLGYYSARCGSPPHVTEALARKAIALDPENVCYRVGLASLLLKQDRRIESYEIVQCMTGSQIDQITCKCCLERIVSLFESAHDYCRVVLCRQQLLALELRDIDSPCE